MEQRILETLHWFALQQMAPTLLELHRFLLSPKRDLLSSLGERGEFVDPATPPDASVSLGQLLSVLETMIKEGAVIFQNGYYSDPASSGLTKLRQEGVWQAILREKRIEKFSNIFRRIPFVQGVTLAGSQALGLPKATSDIDLLVFTAPGWLWFPRTLVTALLHVAGVRRYATKIANRFCLNHYISGNKVLSAGRNLYTACEYAKLRVLYGREAASEFQGVNSFWINAFLPNFEPAISARAKKDSVVKKMFEKLLTNKVGRFLERSLMGLEKPRIKTSEKYIVVADDELSFHPQSKQEPLLSQFFQDQ